MRPWPIAVRRATPADRDAVLAFATTTFDGWDYIAGVWDEWVADRAGALLVATVGPPPDGTPPLDAAGTPIAPGRVVAVSHLAMLSPTEAWVEGIRVDPAVRGLEVATDLQATALRCAADAGATVVRYITSAANEGSLRLGARHGLVPVGCWRFHGRTGEDDRGGPDGVTAVAEALAAAERDATLLRPSATRSPDAWLERLGRDPTFVAGGGLYEHTPWKFQALTAARLADHLGAAEVLALEAGERWALLLVARAVSLREGELWPALLAGDGALAADLLARLGGAAGPLARLRLPDPAPLLAGHEARFAAAGYTPHDGRMVIVERAIGPVAPPPAPDPRRALMG